MTKQLGLGTLLLQHCLPLPCQDDYIMYLCTCLCVSITHLMVMIRSVVESRDLSISTWAVEISRIALMLQPPRPITRLIVFAGTSSRFDLHIHTPHCLSRKQGRLRHSSHCYASSPEHWQQQLKIQVTYTAKSQSSHNAPCLLTCSCFFK